MLTDNVIVALTGLYGHAKRTNRNKDFSSMRNEVLASYFIISTEENPSRTSALKGKVLDAG